MSMKKMRRSVRLTMTALTLLFVSIGIYLPYNVYVNGTRWRASPYNTFNKAPGPVTRGDIYDRRQERLAVTVDGRRAYTADDSIRFAVAHVIGDDKLQVKNSVEAMMSSYLLGMNASFLTKVTQAFNSEPLRGDDVFLTIDGSLSAYTAGLFPKGSKGAAVIVNYLTGDVLVMTSLPTFDLTWGGIGISKDALTNRATEVQYAPGSLFKVIMYAAALENIQDIETRQFTCTGQLPIEHGTIVEAGAAVHGQLDIRRAFEVSCNTTFAALALELDYRKIERTARQFGFNEETLFRDIVMENGSYPLNSKDRGLDNLAQSGIGQGSVTATPLQMALAACAVANGGLAMEPRLLLMASQPGQARLMVGGTEYKRMMPSSVANKIKEAMIGAVTNGSANRATIPGHIVAGKTGTAEVSSDKSVPTNAWFMGFIADDNHPWAICVLVEGGGYGSITAAPIAQKALTKLLEMGY